MIFGQSTKNKTGFSLVEIMVVLAVLFIGLGISFFAINRRVPHYRLRGHTREVLETMKLAQASAIRQNGTYRFVRLTNGFGFQFSPQGSTFAANVAPDGRLAQTVTFQSGITFTQTAPPCSGGVSTTCFSPTFRSDGTVNPSGTFGLLEPSAGEILRVTWTIGGGMRVQ